MTYRVWHRQPQDRLDPKPTVFPTDYTQVATVETDDIGRVFQLTNHIDHNWWENPEVTWYTQSRSTSVGDVIEGPAGQRVYVAGVGLRDVPAHGVIPRDLGYF